MEHKTFFYDSRLLAMANLPYVELTQMLGTPLRMMASDAIGEHINYYTYKDRYEVKFFYRVYYIGSVFISSIYDHLYFSNNYTNILKDLTNKQLPSIYRPVIGKLKISDLIENEETDTISPEGDSKSKDISDDVQLLYNKLDTSNNAFNEVMNIQENDTPKETPKRGNSPIYGFNGDTQRACEEIWRILSVEYKMDLIKNCLVIDALNNYYLK